MMDRATPHDDLERSVLTFGTAQPPPGLRVLEAGALRITLSDGAVAGVEWHDTLLIAGIDCPVRDVNWGTWPTEEIEVFASADDTGFRYRRRFLAGDFSGEFSCEGDAGGRMTLAVALTARRDTRTCRAGFVVLHPLAAAGEAATILHSNGESEETRLPRLISPGQPALDIVGLDHAIGGASVRFRFEGEVFEMEDQRNWSDASFKTYCRPLSRPYPYDVAKGETIRQTIHVQLGGSPTASAAPQGTAIALTETQGLTIPEWGLAIDPSWPSDGRLGPMLDAFPHVRLLARIDLAEQSSLDWLTGLNLSSRPFDLEAVGDGDPAALDAQLAGAAQRLGEAGLAPDHLFVLPRPYLRSIQPSEPAPPGATPDEAVALARRHFPHARLGAGMLTNFTELNRRPPGLGHAGYATHSLTAIVHAADDRSVMATLGTLEPIFATLESRAKGKPCRLGLASVGMRTNPYGAGVLDNPSQLRLAMAGADPRQRGLLGAAFMVGVVSAALGRSIEFVALGAPYGPFGLACSPAAWPQPGFDDDPKRLVYPAFHAFRALGALAGLPCLGLALPDGLKGVAARTGSGARLVVANCSDKPATAKLPDGASALVLDTSTAAAAIADPQWLRTAKAETLASLALEPYAVAFIGIETGDGA